MSVEVTYPAPESASGSILTLMMNVGSLIFIFTADYISVNLINWLLTGSVAGLGLLLVMMKEDYKRNNVDVGVPYETINT
jgi:hypothetical protein